MLGINVIYTMKPGKRDAFLAEIAACGVQQAVRKENGCLQYDYFASVDSPDLLLLLEKWTDLNAQELHLTQPHMTQIAPIKQRCVQHMSLEKYEL